MLIGFGVIGAVVLLLAWRKGLMPGLISWGGSGPQLAAVTLWVIGIILFTSTRFAPGVARRACELIRPLALPDLEMRFEIEPDLYAAGAVELDGQRCRVTGHGADQVRLRVRTNRGEAPGEVGAIASGGERSRIWLGLSVLADRRTERPLLLFDEIDAGLGMDNARPVAALLARLAAGRQVVCITHLATVAVQGGRHWVVRKAPRGRRTVLTVSEAAGEERVLEVARLLGGAAGGQGPVAAQVAYARELLAGRDPGPAPGI